MRIRLVYFLCFVGSNTLFGCTGLNLFPDKAVDTADEAPPLTPETDSAEDEEVSIFFNSYHWSGTAEITEGAYVGVERIRVALQQPESDLFNCDMIWDLLGTPAASNACDNCIFTFDIIATPRLDEGVQDGSCDLDWGDPLLFSYSYSPVYLPPGQVESAPALLVDDGLGWAVGILSGQLNDRIPDYENEVVYDESTNFFSYSAGYYNFQMTQ